MKKVAYVGGYWCPNIGNGFFNLGADYVLKQVFGDENVTMVFDQPAGITQWKTEKGNPPNAIDYIGHLDVDYVVLLGPVISRSFLNMWRPSIEKLAKCGTRYMILSGGMMKYNDEVLNEIKSFFKEYPPYVLTTRDRSTYNEFKDFADHAYDGVCFAYFTPDAYKPVPTTGLSPYIAVNFDKVFEPEIRINDPQSGRSDKSFEFEGDRFDLKFMKMFTQTGLKTDRITDALVYALAPFPHKKRPDKIGKYTLIRTDHRYSPMFMNKVYRYSNTFCADIPHTYLNIYSQAALTISDRVHACAVTLAYGNSAMFFAKTGRDELLERVGADGIHDHPVKIDLENLKKEKNALVSWLKNIEY